MVVGDGGMLVVMGEFGAIIGSGGFNGFGTIVGSGFVGGDEGWEDVVVVGDRFSVIVDGGGMNMVVVG